MASATSQVGFDVKLLTTLRAIAVVGFVLMSRLKDVSFKELYRPSSSSPQLPIIGKEEIETLVYQLIAKGLTQQKETIVTEEHETSVSLLNQPSSDSIPQENVQPLTTGQQEASGSPEPSEEGNDRLQRAYQVLKAEGQRISGRTLAARAHMRRTTCNQWLVLHHPDEANGTG